MQRDGPIAQPGRGYDACVHSRKAVVGSQPSAGDATSDARPLWKQVLDDLERRIAAGDISHRFPTDKELTERYGVSRHTVREAVRRLRARGLVERHRGRGSFLNEQVLTLGGLYSLFQAVEDQGLEQRSEVLALERRRDPDAAERLQLPATSELVYLERIRLADGTPLALDSVWLPLDIGRHILDVDFTHTALYDELQERAGIRMTEVEETIEPVMPDADARSLLALGGDEALLRVSRLGMSGDRPVECRVTLLRGQRFRYTNSWRAAGPPTA